MESISVTVAGFSPTGTSMAVAEAIAGGLEPQSVATVDLTRPEVREQALVLTECDLLIVAVPVYMGRVPALLGGWFERLEASDTPAVCVVVYGNRAYENALLELGDLVHSRGCVPVAGGAYIGEHSFADADHPVAFSRPDASDLDHAAEFGRSIRKKLGAVTSVHYIPMPDLPGERPYGGVTELWDVDFIEVDESCVQCGHCASVCPVGAIADDDSARIDQVRCITCCACIKQCPQSARTMKAGPVKEAQNRLNTLFCEPKMPENYL